MVIMVIRIERGMECEMTIEYLKCRADLNFEVDFEDCSKQHHWYDCDQVGSYYIACVV